MFRNILALTTVIFLPVILCQCVTTEGTTSTSKPAITVEGTMFYPDGTNQSYIVPAGAEIIGAGGTNCRYIVENGGRMTAHSGKGNVYMIKSGGSFKGFDHPATNCRVQYQAGANVEQVQSGTGVRFNPVD